MARSACSTFQAGCQSIKAGGGEIPPPNDAATLPEKRNRPILHPGGPEQFPLTRSRWQLKHLMDGLSWPTVQAGYESIKACRVVICKKRNSPVLHLTGGRPAFTASSYAPPRGRWHCGTYLCLCLVATLRRSHWLRGHLPHHHQLCRQTDL